jgi:hypothetical protein
MKKLFKSLQSDSKESRVQTLVAQAKDAAIADQIITQAFKRGAITSRAFTAAMMYSQREACLRAMAIQSIKLR